MAGAVASCAAATATDDPEAGAPGISGDAADGSREDTSVDAGDTSKGDTSVDAGDICRGSTLPSELHVRCSPSMPCDPRLDCIYRAGCTAPEGTCERWGRCTDSSILEWVCGCDGKTGNSRAVPISDFGDACTPPRDSTAPPRDAPNLGD